MKILILTGRFGMGHYSVARALSERITAEVPGAQCVVVDLLAEALGEILGAIPILQVGIPAVLSVYFDLFSSFMQAFIFCMLTMLYIANAAEE